MEILRRNPALKGSDGVYRISADGVTKRVLCDMTTQGGGWTVSTEKSDRSAEDAYSSMAPDPAFTVLPYTRLCIYVFGTMITSNTLFTSPVYMIIRICSAKINMGS